MISRSTDIRSALRSRQRGFLLNPHRFGAADPNFANVSLLLHFDGPNASTTFTDSSSNGFTATVVGNAQISTAQSRFGGSSGLFDGTGDYIHFPTNAAFGFGTGDYTVEGFVRFSITNLNRCVFDNRGASVEGIGVYVDSSAVTPSDFRGRLSLSTNVGFIAVGASTAFSASSNFQHWAVTRASGTIRGFIDGTLVWSGTDSRTLASAAPAYVGANYLGTQEYVGYQDEMRVTKGVARYTASFTAPSAPFPNS